MCYTCNVLVCASCVTGIHNGHTFSKLVDELAKLREENETQMHGKTNEANQNMKKIKDSLKSFDNAVESVIKAITDESSMINCMVNQSITQMIVLVKEQPKKEKDKLTKMLSDAQSVLVTGQNLDNRKDLDKTRQDATMVKQIQRKTRSTSYT
ncbi:unnamed protein product [Mytilus coruscus]|uniref:B box-type domain-containing protein n=1 Tax=Mytilus coruscus TaxID=42192 RepID=A0A6J8EXU2_MYTCO|nr:unnamed protein product [Mytilus coruscus]